MPILGDLPPPLPANEGPQERLRMAGQRNDAAPRAENIIAWRPFRPRFEHLGRAESNMIFLREGNGEDRAEALNQAISAIWPDLREVFWIRVNLHFNWIDGHALDDQMEQVLVICDDLQFPTFTTWRGGVLELDVTNPGDIKMS